MAKNLRAKIPITDKLVICDRNTNATDNFMMEAGARSEGEKSIEVVKTPRKVAEQSVSYPPSLRLHERLFLYDEHVQWMI